MDDKENTATLQFRNIADTALTKHSKTTMA